MSDRPKSINQLSFKRKFAAALIDGIILNTGLGVISAIISNIASDIAVVSTNLGNFDVVLSLVYFATLDSIPQQLRVGSKLVAMPLGK